MEGEKDIPNEREWKIDFIIVDDIVHAATCHEFGNNA